jgi:hypothetical protein
MIANALGAMRLGRIFSILGRFAACSGLVRQNLSGLGKVFWRSH